ncbi:insulinase family protein [Pseudoalteromonas ulvae]|uniref:Protease 3 n=1 Tax=Pseudoalteromonas ulvae TaxID=107327 RepID=A0A244CSD7_PSEDV|nr:insulinase family protein [Pseudoalteromonas ulvae]OUL58513.1 peptidase M16 [Pseudoalteromonas ulvae]
MNISRNDNRTYHPLTLDNGLKVLLIQDTHSEKAAASLTVNAGHFDDPDHRQGLAHFLEHMLFLGTDRHPEPGILSQFTSQHGGSCNAWTGTEHSSYFFEIDNPFFYQALEIFSRFFIAPLITEQATTKERSAIDAEFKLKLKDDSRRIYQVHKETANPAHPFAKFSVGNKETLNDTDTSICHEIRDFFEQHYRAGYMTLAICSPIDVAEQVVWVRNLFAEISPADNAKPVIEAPLYLPQHLGKFIVIEPHKHMQKLIISFAMPNIDEFYRHKSVSFLAHILGYEGKGSLYSVLKQRGWINGLSAGGGINGSNFKDFNFSINLTDEGANHYLDIVESVFAFLQLLHDPATDFSRLYQDKKTLLDIAFDNQEKSRLLDWISGLSANMHHYPEIEYISGDFLMDGFNSDHWQCLLGWLEPHNMRVVLIDPSVSTNQTTAWYHTPYAIEDLDATWLKQLSTITHPHPDMALPAINPYLSKAATLHDLEPSPALPIKIHDEVGFDFWFKQDHTYRVAKGHFYLAIDSELAVKDIHHMAMTRLLADLFMDKVAEEFYPAELAGLSYQLTTHQGGLTLHTSGLSANQCDLVDKLLAHLYQCEFSPLRFAEYKKQLCRHWLSGNHNKPVSQLFSQLSSTLLPWNPTPEALAEALATCSFAQFEYFCQELLSKIHLQALLHGNWQREDAQQFVSVLKTRTQSSDTMPDLTRPLVTVTQAQVKHQILHHADHALVVYFQAQTESVDEKVSLMCLNHIISQDYFQYMRTDKQLGYLVGTGYAPLNSRAGIALYVQSPTNPSDDLLAHHDQFTQQYYKRIQSLSEQDWHQIKMGLMTQIMEKDKNLRVRSQRYWLSLNNQDFKFNMQARLQTSLSHLTQSTLADFCQQLFSENSVKTVLLSAQNEKVTQTTTKLSKSL